PGCCPGLGASALSGRLGKSLREIMASRRICNPPSKNVRPIKPGGFVIPQQKEKHTPLLRISNPQSLKRLGHFLTPDFKSGGTPSFAADFKSAEPKKVRTFFSAGFQIRRDAFLCCGFQIRRDA
ncbi:hypothetical protein, partial [Segatella copri]|uniref:hypothetical protein n=1 Tax=Segatella copri TaxID=165179 RepID=UPI003F9DD967